jgi:hypothetical protein
MMAEAPVPDTGSAAEPFRLALRSPGGTYRRGAAKWVFCDESVGGAIICRQG